MLGFEQTIEVPFNVGDRVRCVDDYDPWCFFGDVGTVTDSYKNNGSYFCSVAIDDGELAYGACQWRFRRINESAADTPVDVSEYL